MSTRVRSPNYPSISLPEAVTKVGKVFAVDRAYSIDREVAVKHMDYSSLNGASAKVLASIIQYGLMEKTGKNQVRVSRLAVSILHPESPGAKRAAIREAAMRPALFSELYGDFPDGVPSEASLRSHLMRADFSNVAINPAIRSYVQTYEYAEQAGAFESHGSTASPTQESSHVQGHEEDEPMEAAAPISATPQRAPAAPPAHVPIDDADLNDIRYVVSGGKVLLNATLDLEGLDRLERKLSALRQLLED